MFQDFRKVCVDCKGKVRASASAKTFQKTNSLFLLYLKTVEHWNKHSLSTTFFNIYLFIYNSLSHSPLAKSSTYIPPHFTPKIDFSKIL